MKATTVAVATVIPTVAPLVTGLTVSVRGERSVAFTTQYYYQDVLPLLVTS